MKESVRRCPTCSTLLQEMDFCARCALGGTLFESDAKSANETSTLTFGGYDLLEEIGQDGAMGSVYKAHDRSANRMVALKMLRADRLRSVELVQRFQIEVQAAANLDHPNILPVYDVGEINGQHYYTMRLAGGGSLARQLETGAWEVSSLDVDAARTVQRAMARLMYRVADAVQHAHERGVLHRDLKPGNLLLDSDGTVYVSDFGLAKLLNSGSDLTRSQGMVGTPAYMAPEQIADGSRNVTAKADVWAMGVVLYQLLTGRLPFQGDNPIAILDALRTREPVAPIVINPLIDPDLNTIVLSCLEKDPTRRCPSARELSNELERFLSFQPINSRPLNRRERLLKWYRRDRLFAKMAVGILSAVVIGSAISVWQAIVARAAANVARTQAERSEQVSGFLRGMLEQVQPSVALGRDTTLLKDVLDNAAKRIDGGFVKHPEVEEELQDLLGQVYRDMGEYDNATIRFQRAVTLCEARLGKSHLDHARRLGRLARVLYDNGNFESAESIQREVLAFRTRVLDQNHTEVIDIRSELGETLSEEAKYAESETLLKSALQSRLTTSGEEHLDVADSMNALGYLRMKQGLYEDAEDYYRKALALRSKLLEKAHPLIANTLNDLAIVLTRQARLDEAEETYKLALAQQKQIHDGDHPDVAATLNNLANAMADNGKLLEALANQREALAMRQRVFGPQHLDVAISLNNLGSLQLESGDSPQAVRSFQEALTIWRKLLAPDHPNIAYTIDNMGGALTAMGHYPEAEALHLESLELRRKSLGQSHPDVAKSLSNLGALLSRQGSYARALTVLRQALEIRRSRLDPMHQDLAKSLLALAKVELQLGQVAESERLVRECLHIWEVRPFRRLPFYEAQTVLGACSFRLGNVEEAEWLLSNGCDMARHLSSHRSSDNEATLRQMHHRLFAFLDSTGRIIEAEVCRSHLESLPWPSMGDNQDR